MAQPEPYFGFGLGAELGAVCWESGVVPLPACWDRQGLWYKCHTVQCWRGRKAEVRLCRWECLRDGYHDEDFLLWYDTLVSRERVSCPACSNCAGEKHSRVFSKKVSVSQIFGEDSSKISPAGGLLGTDVRVLRSSTIRV